VQAHIELGDVQPRVGTNVRVLTDLRRELVAYIRRGNDQVERLYTLDRADPWGIDTRSAESKAFASERLAAGATMLRDLWWTAWITSAGTAERP
jgi:hypothetical protein